MDFTLNFHKDENEYICNYVKTNGCWEPCTTEILVELFKQKSPDTVFVDVGANIGYFSIIAACSNVPVLAFEPIDANYSLLKTAIIQNKYEKLVLGFKVALSSKQDEVMFNVAKSNMGLCSVDSLPEDLYSYSEKCITQPLDKFFGASTVNDIIIKIDVGNSWYDVLLGMEETMQSGRISYVIIEVPTYDSMLFSYFRKYGFDTCINIGFSDRKNVDCNTSYLKSAEYVCSIDSIEKDFLNNQDSPMMILFYKKTIVETIVETSV